MMSLALLSKTALDMRNKHDDDSDDSDTHQKHVRDDIDQWGQKLDHNDDDMEQGRHFNDHRVINDLYYHHLQCYHFR